MRRDSAGRLVRIDIHMGGPSMFSRFGQSNQPMPAEAGKALLVNTKEGEGTLSLHVPNNKHTFTFRHHYLGTNPDGDVQLGRSPSKSLRTDSRCVVPFACSTMISGPAPGNSPPAWASAANTRRLPKS